MPQTALSSPSVNDHRAELMPETSTASDPENNKEAEETAAASKRTSGRATTDLVRLYLTEIGRVPLLQRDEEVSEAQIIQRYVTLIDLRAQLAAQAAEPFSHPLARILLSPAATPGLWELFLHYLDE
ncbi:MAG: sigma-70 factor domain-containing protein [Spirulinaceae cyanobacterium]